MHPTRRRSLCALFTLAALATPAAAHAANRYAVVGYDGSFVRGHGVTGVSHLGAGRWVVTFTSNVAGCAYLATVADPSNQLVFNPGLVYAQTAGTTATGVYVETKNLAGGLQDYPYHLTIDCPTTRRFAVVAANGTFVRGSHALGTRHIGAGRYVVTFDRSVAGCATTATEGDPGTGIAVVPGEVYTQGTVESPLEVYVETKNLGGGLQDLPFHVNLACARRSTTTLFANVGYSTNLTSSSAGVSLAAFGAGRYELTFPINVSGCAYTATEGDPGTGIAVAPGLVFAAGGHLSGRGVYVETKNLAAGLQAGLPFHLVVTC